MCHLVITKSIHCDDFAHTKSRRVTCSKMWGQPWHRVARCKNERTLQDEHAEECQHCGWQVVEEARPVAEPWDPSPPNETFESANSNVESSPEPWQWSASEEEGDTPDVLVGKDTGMTVDECYEEPCKH